MSDSCDCMNCSPPGSSVHGILQARILEWVAIAFSRGSFPSRDRTWAVCIAGRFFSNWATREAPVKHWLSVITSLNILRMEFLYKWDFKWAHRLFPPCRVQSGVLGLLAGSCLANRLNAPHVFLLSFSHHTQAVLISLAASGRQIAGTELWWARQLTAVVWAEAFYAIIVLIKVRNCLGMRLQLIH